MLNAEQVSETQARALASQFFNTSLPVQAPAMKSKIKGKASKLTINLYFDAPTSISEITDQQHGDLQGPIYNLNGQQVTRPGKGIYIVGGKKVIFK